MTPSQLVLYASIFSTIVLYIVISYQKKFNQVKIHIINNYKLVFTLGLINPFLYYLVLSELFKKTPMSTHGDELKKFLRK
jgi:hypothetical protein